MSRKRYAQVGLGSRAEMYYRAVITKHAETSEMVGFCDVNEGRLRLAVARAHDWGAEVRGYEAEDFDRMIAECRPHAVIVTTMDSVHDKYICRAMELGCDVITEKPMTIDEVKCQRIINTQRRTGKKCTVTFNYRYAPYRTQVKQLLMSGVVGNVLSGDFHWMLDIQHGADYFRRWHRRKENSGGLMVHKATHHFDLINWWLSSVPESVFARGHRRFYTPETAARYGLGDRAERCLHCPEAQVCRFRLDIRSNEELRTLYLENEEYDGYIRDKCVFSDQITIEDCMNVIVDYRSGAKLNYSLNAFMPWEGYTITLNGSKGRLEHHCIESSYISGDGTIPGQVKKEETRIVIYPHFGEPYSVDIWTETGAHGGGDEPMLEDLLCLRPSEDKYRRAADQRAGAYSILTGIAANRSMVTGEPVYIDDLVHDIGLPDFASMPSPDEPLSFDDAGPLSVVP